MAIGHRDHVAPSMAIVETTRLTVGLAARVDLATRRQFRPSKVPLQARVLRLSRARLPPSPQARALPPLRAQVLLPRSLPLQARARLRPSMSP